MWREGPCCDSTCCDSTTHSWCAATSCCRVTLQHISISVVFINGFSELHRRDQTQRPHMTHIPFLTQHHQRRHQHPAEHQSRVYLSAVVESMTFHRERHPRQAAPIDSVRLRITPLQREPLRPSEPFRRQYGGGESPTRSAPNSTPRPRAPRTRGS